MYLRIDPGNSEILFFNGFIRSFRMGDDFWDDFWDIHFLFWDFEGSWIWGMMNVFFFSALHSCFVDPLHYHYTLAPLTGGMTIAHVFIDFWPWHKSANSCLNMSLNMTNLQCSSGNAATPNARKGIRGAKNEGMKLCMMRMAFTSHWFSHSLSTDFLRTCDSSCVILCDVLLCNRDSDVYFQWQGVFQVEATFFTSSLWGLLPSLAAVVALATGRSSDFDLRGTFQQ